ncbi:hypothetical protein DC487_15070 [Sphingobacterium corticibacter]|uniref:Uncharacterized protein n=1 Tax=Sphingobacterium corticibacter TaxID=2171749 RepID=A0A2T8HG26_9SPHI|nr:hypothetical protein DC487_15070 [Sphingobacterium corticibacter]
MRTCVLLRLRQGLQYIFSEANLFQKIAFISWSFVATSKEILDQSNRSVGKQKNGGVVQK